jgi:hypothetical protein
MLMKKDWHKCKGFTGHWTDWKAEDQEYVTIIICTTRCTAFRYSQLNWREVETVHLCLKRREKNIEWLPRNCFGQPGKW